MENRRKSISRISMLATPMMIVCGLLFAGSSAWADDDKPVCTVKTLKGRYLWVDKATNLPPFAGVTGPTPATNAGFHLFNGDGTGMEIITFILNGVTILKNAVVPFSYTVNADCTGTVTALVPNGPHFDIFVAPDGGSVAYIGADPGNGVNDIAQRVSPN
jgi:hypothetical protein